MLSAIALICFTTSQGNAGCVTYAHPIPVQTAEECEVRSHESVFAAIELLTNLATENGATVQVHSYDRTCVSWISS